MLTIEIKSNIAEKLGSMLPRAIDLSVRKAALVMRDQVKLNVTGRVLKTRTGKLRDTWGDNPQVTGSGEETVAILTSHGLVYAAIHEYGGTIVPKNARVLCLPLPAMLLDSGGTRATPRMVIQDPRAYGYGGTFFRKGILFGWTPQKRGEGKITPLFSLKKSVTIPARHYVSLAVRASGSLMQDAVNAECIKVLREGKEAIR